MDLWLTLLLAGASRCGSVWTAALRCSALHGVPPLVLTEALLYAVKQPV